ncbi:MAG: CHAT domain-containing protein [Aureliella sp.]
MKKQNIIPMIGFISVVLLVLTNGRSKAQELSDLEKALPTIRGMNDPATLIGALQGAAMEKMQTREIDKAITYIDEAISIARKQGNPEFLSTPLLVATQILNRASPDRATKFLIRILNGEQGKPEVELVILKQLGEHLQQSGDIVAAIQVLHDFQAKSLEQHPDSEIAAWALLQYGQACLNGQMFDLAQPALSQCKQLADKIGKQEIAALCNASLANACLGTKQYDMAVDLFMAQLENAKEAQNEQLAISAISGLVTALIGGARLDEASTVLNNNIADASGVMQGELLALRATLETARGENPKALASSQAAASARLKSIPFFTRGMVGAATVMQDKIAQAYLQLDAGELDQAMKAAAEAERGYRQIRNQMERAAKLGAVNLDSALTGYSTILSSISGVRQQILVSQGKHEEALLEAEAGRGQAQLQAMQRLFKVDEDDFDIQPLDLDAIRRLAKESNSTIVEFSAVHPIDFLTRARLGETGKKFAGKMVYVWVVTPPGDIYFHELTLPTSLKEFVKSLRNEITPPKKETASDASTAESNEEAGPNQNETVGSYSSDVSDGVNSTKFQRLAFDLLWWPLREHLPKEPTASVILAPHAELFAVPFAALLDASNTPLIELHTLTTVGSIELFHAARQRLEANNKFDADAILIVGNPEMPKYQFRPDRPAAPLDPLPGSEREAKAIASMFGIEPLLGADASESKVKRLMQSAPVIHMATHGLLEADSVFTRNYLSSMALAADEETDGFLTVREVMEMELSAELAVLSACDSGRGEITGEGVVGLSRAYLTAGVPNVVVSLWPVSDQATAYMMVEFYQALGKGQQKAAALRTAILATREQVNDPELWAPFLLYGAGI